jgi:sRNA-binding protein
MSRNMISVNTLDGKQAGELEKTNSTTAINAIAEANRSGNRQNDQERNHEKDFCCRGSHSARLPTDADKRRGSLRFRMTNFRCLGEARRPDPPLPPLRSRLI